MVRHWEQGRTVIEALIKEGRLERVPPSRAQAEALIAEARRHLASAKLVLASDPAGAYALLYDAARKGLAGVLENEGLRPKSFGGHLALYEAVRAQLDPPLGGVLRSFDRMRRRRNEVEYRSSSAPRVTAEEVGADIAKVTAIIDLAARVVPDMPPY